MNGRVVLPTFGNKSRKTTKSDPSTGDQLGKRKCLFTFFSTEFRADRWLNGGSNNEPLTRSGDVAFGDLNRVIVGQIEENDEVRPVYGGSVEEAACRNLARSCAPKPGRVPKPGRRSHAEARPGRERRSLAAGRVPKPGRPTVTARRGPARPGPARPGSAGGGRETGKTDSMTVAITCACRRMNGRVVLPTFGNKSRKTTKSEPSTGDKF